MEGRDDGVLAMSAKERERLVVIRAVCERRLLQAEAAELVSKRRGRPSARLNMIGAPHRGDSCLRRRGGVERDLWLKALKLAGCSTMDHANDSCKAQETC